MPLLANTHRAATAEALIKKLEHVLMIFFDCVTYFFINVKCMPCNLLKILQIYVKKMLFKIVL